MAQGDVLYRDFWDLKPPGIFLFYYAAGRLFGFSEMGVHIFELLWMVFFGGILMIVLAKAFGTRIACLAVLFTICPYYLLGSFWDLTQPEPILNLPIFIVLSALVNARSTSPHRPFWLLLAGSVGGIVFLFKPVLFLIPFSMYVLFLHMEYKSSQRPWRLCAFLLFGSALPVLATTTFFLVKGSLSFFLNTLLIIPLQIAHSVSVRPRLWLLRIFSEWFIRDHAALLLLAAVGVVLILFRYRPLSSQQRLMVYGALTWGITDAIAIAVQTWSWWHYHFLLLLFPVGLLAAIGVDGLVSKAGVRGRSALISTAMLMAALLLSIPLGKGVISFCRNSPRWSAALQSSSARLAYQQSMTGAYRDFRSEMEFLRTPGAEKGSVYIFGAPEYYLFTDRARASAVHNQMPELLTPGLRQRVADDLARNRPTYIFVADGQRNNIISFAAYLKLLKDHYVVQRESRWGAWYHRGVVPN